MVMVSRNSLSVLALDIAKRLRDRLLSGISHKLGVSRPFGRSATIPAATLGWIRVVSRLHLMFNIRLRHTGSSNMPGEEWEPTIRRAITSKRRRLRRGWRSQRLTCGTSSPIRVCETFSAVLFRCSPLPNIFYKGGPGTEPETGTVGTVFAGTEP